MRSHLCPNAPYTHPPASRPKVLPPPSFSSTFFWRTADFALFQIATIHARCTLYLPPAPAQAPSTLAPQAMTYLLALQLVSMSSEQSLASALCGLVAGVVFRLSPLPGVCPLSNFSILQRAIWWWPVFSVLAFDLFIQEKLLPALRYPAWLNSWAASTMDKFEQARANARRDAQRRRGNNPGSGHGEQLIGGHGGRGGVGGGGGGAAAAAAAPVGPDPESVATLVAMGFDEARVRAALARSANNVNIAAQRLLEG